MADNLTNSRQPVVKIVHPDDPTKWQIINAEDFDAAQHELWDKAKEVLQPDPNAAPGIVPSDRNPTGTYSEPTPTDVRFPNKDATEFENNHGAFIGRNAAQLREEAKLPDAPGGLATAVEIPADAVPSGEVAALAEKLGGGADLPIGQAAEVVDASTATRTRAADPKVAESAKAARNK
ncbi:hypothetical protein [Roseomonas chloroacetimidivorans]|uniref:hypothetical protein n=1 Tax=Roseomonas chloroacetimidivorans TaxID=1766656 RepID=UPI003C7948B3